ncbi:Uncharacterised protein [Mycobacteroides abscessus subsp. abscessus]|nr:Uncharacterised protein [Mycobacteroides abscessus subsp. abscessus]
MECYFKKGFIKRGFQFASYLTFWKPLYNKLENYLHVYNLASYGFNVIVVVGSCSSTS